MYKWQAGVVAFWGSKLSLKEYGKNKKLKFPMFSPRLCKLLGMAQ
jgi:hypothetical protein